MLICHQLLAAPRRPELSALGHLVALVPHLSIDFPPLVQMPTFRIVIATITVAIRSMLNELANCYFKKKMHSDK